MHLNKIIGKKIGFLTAIEEMQLDKLRRWVINKIINTPFKKRGCKICI